MKGVLAFILVPLYLVTFWWRLWLTGKKKKKKRAVLPIPAPEQRVVCGTDRGHLALLCQLLQLVGFVLRFYESLLHIFQRLDRQRVAWWRSGGRVEGLGWHGKIQNHLLQELKCTNTIILFRETSSYTFFPEFAEVRAASDADFRESPLNLISQKSFRWWPLLVSRHSSWAAAAARVIFSVIELRGLFFFCLPARTVLCGS